MPNEIQERYEKRPSCLRYLYESGARQQLTDFFLGLAGHWDEDSDPLSKKDLVEKTGMQRKSVIAHIDSLIEMGVVKKVEGSRWDRYAPNVGEEPYEVLLYANNVLGEWHEEHKDELDLE